MTTESLYKSPAGERAVLALYDRVLEDHWPQPHETVNIPTRYGSTFVIASGQASGPALVLLHGAASNSAIWAADAAVFGSQYRVYAVDLLGEAGKSAPHRPAWDSPAYAEWLEEVCDVLKLKRAALLGVSQGGWTALKFAAYRPERVSKLVLMCPGGVTSDRPSFYIRFIPLLLLGRWGAQRANRMLFGKQPIPEEADEYLTLIMTHFKPRTGVAPLFTDQELGRLTMPVLLLGGGQDVIRDARKIADRMGRLVPHLTTTIFPDAGHVLLDTTAPIASFLAAPDPA
jgi:pimeloyl-ACP methyl ester carboxylesterase